MSRNYGQLRALQVDPRPFFLEGGTSGTLLLHGFSGTPREMRPLGDYLHTRGLTIDAPLLPGHGETLAEMSRTKWQAWTGAVESAYARLKTRCEQCIIAGFSMGSLLALWLAENTNELAGIVLYSPALKIANWRLHLTPLLRHFVKSLQVTEESDLYNPEAESWLGGFARYSIPASAELLALQRYVRRNLSRVQAPTLVIYSTGDRSIHPQSGPETVRMLSRQVPVESLVLHDSGHAVVVDQKWETVAETTFRFVEQCVRAT